jgi:transcriptional regulator with AAA-type ATPase domain
MNLETSMGVRHLPSQFRAVEIGLGHSRRSDGSHHRLLRCSRWRGVCSTRLHRRCGTSSRRLLVKDGLLVNDNFCISIARPHSSRFLLERLISESPVSGLHDDREWIDLGALVSPAGYAGIIGNSRAMRTMLATIERFAPYKSTVLITGQSGSGKELTARMLHLLGPFSKGPFISFNCSNLVEGLAESQLFGHIKGAFTHARDANLGCFRQAHGRTLLLDEIGELPAGMQAKLLRVCDSLEIQPVGSTESIQLDLRLLAATNRNLHAMVTAGEFRADLFLGSMLLRLRRRR